MRDEVSGFALAVLKPMVETVEDAPEQNKLWNAAFMMFGGRADLAAEIRMAQAGMWADAGKPDLAGQCCQDVITRYANAGPFVIAALKGAEKMLQETGKPERVVGLYEQTWRRITKPGEMAGEFMTQSNWYVVGMMYVDKLTEAGQGAKAQQVKGQLDAMMTGGATTKTN